MQSEVTLLEGLPLVAKAKAEAERAKAEAKARRAIAEAEAKVRGAIAEAEPRARGAIAEAEPRAKGPYPRSLICSLLLVVVLCIIIGCIITLRPVFLTNFIFTLLHIIIISRLGYICICK